RNSNIENKDIMKDIYNVSLCAMISRDRRRLLYNDIYSTFINDYETLFSNIEKYINTIKNNNLKCKTLLDNEQYSIYGETDLIDFDNKKILDFKCSGSDNFKLEWLLQLLAYTSLIRITPSTQNIEINKIEVYNPIRGLLFTFDISKWNKEKELIEFMNLIRYRKFKNEN